jgi:hypothetical protein
LLDLPTELQVDVLTTWLTLADIATLDSTVCNRRDRQRWLDLLYHPTYYYVHSYFCVEYFEIRTPYEDWQKLRAIAACMKWVLLRSVRVKEIYIDAESLSEEELIETPLYLHRNGRRISRIIFAKYSDRSTAAAALRTVCEHCPNVTHVTCARAFGSSKYRFMTTTWPLLQSAVLHGRDVDSGLSIIAAKCPEVKSTRIHDTRREFIPPTVPRGFADSISPSLLHFEADYTISNADLLPLARRCPNLRSLLCNFLRIGDDALMEVAYCCPQLQAIDLRVSAFISADAILRFAQRLRLVELYASEMPAAVVPHCAQLQTLQLTLADSSGLMRIATHCP